VGCQINDFATSQKPSGNRPRLASAEISIQPTRVKPNSGRRRRARLFVVAAALLLAVPPAAGAHAWLIRAHPQAGAPLRAAPRSVELRFSEAVDARLSGLRDSPRPIVTAPAVA
jgi:hypothetical protein